MAKYKKCPRCELNWIPVDEDYCDVCKAELKIGGATLLEDEEDDELLCPICHTNYLVPGEKICSECARKTGKGADEEYEKDDQPEAKDENEVSFDELAEEEAWNDYDEPFDDNEDFDSDDYGESFDDEEESEDEEEEEYKDDLDDDFNYDINDVEDDEDEEENDDSDDEDDDL